jgi:hypothetical protein
VLQSSFPFDGLQMPSRTQRQTADDNGDNITTKENRNVLHLPQGDYGGQKEIKRSNAQQVDKKPSAGKLEVTMPRSISRHEQGERRKGQPVPPHAEAD